MHEILNDPVDVLVQFAQNRVRPTHVRWGQHTYALQQLNLVHSTREGQKRIFYFSVSDNTNFMKLRLDSETLEWRLVELYSD
ncbi:MAG: hypothetical protein WC730_01415 [Patescibacteria group bacterium]|jgi:hypothetical protein